MIIGVTLAVFQQITGVNMIIYYDPTCRDPVAGPYRPAPAASGRHRGNGGGNDRRRPYLPPAQ
jgi:hypothetical protein